MNDDTRARKQARLGRLRVEVAALEAELAALHLSDSSSDGDCSDDGSESRHTEHFRQTSEAAEKRRYTPPATRHRGGEGAGRAGTRPDRPCVVWQHYVHVAHCMLGRVPRYMQACRQAGRQTDRCSHIARRTNKQARCPQVDRQRLSVRQIHVVTPDWRRQMVGPGGRDGRRQAH